MHKYNNKYKIKRKPQFPKQQIAQEDAGTIITPALSYAATGAIAGSIIPGVGTLIGGAIGLVAGLATGISKNITENKAANAKERAERVAANNELWKRNSVMLSEFNEKNPDMGSTPAFNAGGIPFNPNLIAVSNNEAVDTPYGVKRVKGKGTEHSDSIIIPTYNIGGYANQGISKVFSNYPNPRTGNNFSDDAISISKQFKTTPFDNDTLSIATARRNKVNEELALQALLAEQEIENQGRHKPNKVINGQQQVEAADYGSILSGANLIMSLGSGINSLIDAANVKFEDPVLHGYGDVMELMTRRPNINPLLNQIRDNSNTAMYNAPSNMAGQNAAYKAAVNANTNRAYSEAYANWWNQGVQQDQAAAQMLAQLSLDNTRELRRVSEANAANEAAAADQRQAGLNSISSGLSNAYSGYLKQQQNEKLGNLADQLAALRSSGTATPDDKAAAASAITQAVNAVQSSDTATRAATPQASANASATFKAKTATTQSISADEPEYGTPEWWEWFKELFSKYNATKGASSSTTE
jgi:hypothetical protein